MAKRSLPICIDVPSKADVYITQRLSILYANTVHMESLMMNKFIQLFLRAYYSPDGGIDDMITFYTDAVFLWGGLSFEFNDDEIQTDRIVDEVKHQIDMCKYTSIFLNDFYVEESRRKRHFDHEYLVCGYDDETEEFDTVLYNKRHRYAHLLVKYREVEKGFQNRVSPSFTYLTMECEKGYDHIKDDNRQQVLQLLDDYIHSRTSFDWYFAPTDAVYGYRVYDAMKEKTKHYHTRGYEQVVDMRDFSILEEHKRFMYQRIRDYFHLPELAEAYKPIADMAQSTKFLAMKCAFGNTCAYLDDIVILIEEMKKKERPILERLVSRF